MRFSVLTYNTLFNSAFRGFDSIFKMCQPDIICLQEINTSENSLKQIEKLGYKLADYANSFIKFGTIYGVATFYNPKRLIYKTSVSLPLPRGLFDYIARLIRIGNESRSILKTEFKLIASKNVIYVYNIHLTPYGANGIRLKQLRKTLIDVDQITHSPTILVGDYNYPYGRKKLESLMIKHNFIESTNTIFTTINFPIPFSIIEKILYKIVKIIFPKGAKADYMFHKNCHVIESKRINASYSDHYPIITTYEVNTKTK